MDTWSSPPGVPDKGGRNRGEVSGGEKEEREEEREKKEQQRKRGTKDR